MGMFDEIKDKAEEFADEHKDVVEKVSDQVLDKAGDAVDEATGKKFTGQIEQAERAADDAIG